MHIQIEAEIKIICSKWNILRGGIKEELRNPQAWLAFGSVNDSVWPGSREWIQVKGGIEQ